MCRPCGKASGRCAPGPLPRWKTSLAEWEPCLPVGVRGTSRDRFRWLVLPGLCTTPFPSTGSRSSCGTPPGTRLQWRSQGSSRVPVPGTVPGCGADCLAEWEPLSAPGARGHALRARPLWETGVLPVTPWPGRRPLYSVLSRAAGGPLVGFRSVPGRARANGP